MQRPGARAKRLLFLSPVYPFPLDCGQNVRIANLLRACSRDFEVTLIAPDQADPSPHIERASFFQRAIFVRAGQRPPLLEIAKAYWRSGELIGRGRLAELAGYSEALAGLDLDSFDLIFVERRRLAALVYRHHRKVLVDLDDVEHKKFFRDMKRQAPGLQYARLAIRVIRHWHREVRGTRRYLAVIVCSEVDRRYLRKWGLRRVLTVPNGTELGSPALARDNQRAPQPFRLVFLGNLAYSPNLDALEYIAAEILPKIGGGQLGPVCIDVIGSGATTELAARFPALNFRGFVDNIQAALGGYDAMLAPLRRGGGTKLKLLDAMGAGLPIITTKIGAEGLYLENGRSALIGNSAAEIAGMVERLQSDAGLGASLAAEALAIAEDHFSWPAIRRRLSDVLSSLSSQWRVETAIGPDEASPSPGDQVKQPASMSGTQ